MPIPKQTHSRGLLTVANQYLHGEITAHNAATRLGNGGPFGRLLAGEVMLDQATKSDKYMVSTQMQFARQSYRIATEQAASGQWDQYDHVEHSTKARMRLAQSTAFEVMYRKRHLPQHSTVEDMYNRLLKTAVGAVDVSRSHGVTKSHSAVELRGAIGELAILLLAQRYALREVGCEEWLPLQSSFSEVHGGSCLEATDNYAWNLNIFTSSSDGETPEATYTLQVRSYNDGSWPEPAGPTIYINPDVSLSPTEPWPSEKIIAACDIERQASANDAARLTRDLDMRTDKLLTILG